MTLSPQEYNELFPYYRYRASRARVRAYVASDPYCKKECGFFDPGCRYHKYHLGCGGSTIPGIARYQPGKMTSSGSGGEEKDKDTGCATADWACIIQNQVTKPFKELPKWIMYAIAAVIIIVVIVIVAKFK